MSEIFHKAWRMASHVLPNPAHYLHPSPGWRVYFTYPFARNHSTASANACFGGVCGNLSTRIALAGLNHILYLAMRTPASGARGGLPVKKEVHSLHVRRSQRNPIRNFHFRRGHAGNFLQRGQGFPHGPVAFLVAQNITFAHLPLFRRQNVPGGHVADVNPVQSGVKIRRQFAIQKIHNHLAGRRRFHIARADGRGGIDDDDGQPVARQLRGQAFRLPFGAFVVIGQLLGGNHVQFR